MKTLAIRYNNGSPQEQLESLTQEGALQIKINNSPFTITMRTPGDDVLLATGLLFTEGVISSVDEIMDIVELSNENESTLEIKVKEGVMTNKIDRNRSIPSSSSCGLCGKTELADLVDPDALNTTPTKLDIRLVPQLLQQMNQRQSTFEETGGSHAASVFSSEGKMLTAKEDIGRHNAVDKVIGHLLLKKELDAAEILFVSGRVSYEIVTKCARAKISFLLAVSAPSSLAVDTCRKLGITLIAFCRENRATVYTNQQNILQSMKEVEVSTL